jgi:hypothetical protein
MRQSLLILAFCLALLFASPLSATTHYVTPSGAGSKNGADWNNAYADIPSSLTRGDTYVLAGGTYGSHTFSTADSGSTYIYIRKAQAGTFNGVAYNDDLVAGWNSSYQTTQALFTSSSGAQWTITTDYWSFDGVQPATLWDSSPADYGIKIIPAAPSQQNHLVEIGQWPAANHGNYVILKHIATVNAGPSYDQNQFNFVYSGGTAGDYIGYCYAANGGNLIRLNGVQNVIVEYNFIGSIVYFSDNHGESIGMDLESYSSGQAPSNTTIRYNWFDDSGTTNSTGQIITLTNTGDTNDGVYVYGNVFVNLTGHNGLGSGNSGGPGTLSNWKFYNNTFVNSLVDFTDLSTGSEFRNNLMYNSPATVFSGSGPATRSNNYWNSSSNGIGSGTSDVTSSESTSVLFQNYAGADYRLGASSQALNIGFTLPSPFNVDADGVTRTPGAWDAGAYNSGISASTPSAPTNLAATVN